MRRRRGLLAICLCLVTAVASAEQRLVIFDVGEGLAVMLQHAQDAILIDTGHAGRVAGVLARMRQRHVRQLDRLILTHLHPDHASGYFRIRETFPDIPVFYNGQPLPRDIAPDMVRWVNEALAADPHSERLAAGDRMRWHDSVIDVLWPSEFHGSGLNRHSLVLSIRYGETGVLIMGDADAGVEDALLARNAIRPADILIAGHHGSAATSTAAFLTAVHASHAVVSVDHDNIRGYPDATTLARLHKYSGEVLRTDIDGEICFELSGRRGRQSRCAP